MSLFTNPFKRPVEEYSDYKTAYATRSRAAELAVQSLGYEPEGTAVNTQELYARACMWEAFLQKGSAAVVESGLLDDEAPEGKTATVLKLVKP